MPRGLMTLGISTEVIHYGNRNCSTHPRHRAPPLPGPVRDQPADRQVRRGGRGVQETPGRARAHDGGAPWRLKFPRSPPSPACTGAPSPDSNR